MTLTSDYQLSHDGLMDDMDRLSGNHVYTDSSSSERLQGRSTQRLPANNSKIEALRQKIENGPPCTLKQLLDEGYEISEIGPGYIVRGEKVADVKLIKKINDSTSQKVGRAVRGVLLGPLSAIKMFKDDTWNPLANGVVERVVVTKKKNDTDPENIAALTKKLGYDIRSPASMEAYVKSLLTPSHKNYNPSMVENIEGNLVVRELRRPGISSFILIPGGDYKKAHVRKFYRDKDKSSYTDPKEAYRAIRAVIVAVTSPHVKKEFRKICLAKAKLQFERLTDEEKSAELAKEQTDQQGWIEKKAKSIRQAQRRSVIDPTFNSITFFGETDVDDNHSVGTMVTMSDLDEKQLKDIYKMESKGKVQGDTPFKNPPPIQNHPQEEETE